ncbi:MAG TPA: sensor histidine kinase [Candidatus Saccharimonadales bacterium]|nr:sensor histidine kinase [Candidatus Saccharimonadales bacterium]
MDRHDPAAPHPSPADPIRSRMPALALGLRLLTLAVVAASGAFLPASDAQRDQLLLGVLAGAAVGFAQFFLPAGSRFPRAAFVVAHAGVWTCLTHATCGSHTPLFVGYLLEPLLSGAALGRRGCTLAGATGAAAYVAHAALLDRPADPGAWAAVVGFIAVSTLLTWFLIEVLERQSLGLRASHAALSARADSLVEELRLLGDYLGGALVRLDGVGRVAGLNAAGAALLGVQADAVRGRAWQEVLRPTPDGARAITRTLAEGEPQRGLSMLLRTASGRWVGVTAEIWLSPSPEGRQVFLLLEPRARDRAPEEPLRRLGEAAACVAHQIKNSIHALMGMARGLLEDARVGPAAEAKAEQYLGALRTLSGLADDVLAMAGSSGPPREPVPLRETLNSALLLLSPAGCQVRMPAVDRQLCVETNRGLLIHALFNLLDNACRATPPGGTVEIRAQAGESRVVLEILDGGPGLPSELAGAAGPVRSEGGHGYGLLAARRFLDAAGGNLSLGRGPAGGTLCRLELPASRAPQEVLA